MALAFSSIDAAQGKTTDLGEGRVSGQKESSPHTSKDLNTLNNSSLFYMPDETSGLLDDPRMAGH